MGAIEAGFAINPAAKQVKKQLLKAIRKGTKPPRGFGQWCSFLSVVDFQKQLDFFVLKQSSMANRHGAAPCR